MSSVCGSDLVVMDGIELTPKNRIFEGLRALFDHQMEHTVFHYPFWD